MSRLRPCSWRRPPAARAARAGGSHRGRSTPLSGRSALSTTPRLPTASASLGPSPHDLRHTFGYRLSETSGHNRAELERRLGHANDRYLRLYTNPPEDIAAGYVEDL